MKWGSVVELAWPKPQIIWPDGGLCPVTPVNYHIAQLHCMAHKFNSPIIPMILDIPFDLEDGDKWPFLPLIEHLLHCSAYFRYKGDPHLRFLTLGVKRKVSLHLNFWLSDVSNLLYGFHQVYFIALTYHCAKQQQFTILWMRVSVANQIHRHWQTFGSILLWWCWELNTWL